jgi:hypothetical protein
MTEAEAWRAREEQEKRDADELRRINAVWERERKAEEAKELERQRKEDQRKAERIKQRDALPYSDALAQEICERIAVGELLLDICSDEHMPTQRRCNQWLVAEPAFNALYQSAINDRLNVFEEQVIKIADAVVRDADITKGNTRTIDPARVTAAKLRIEVRFRHLKAMRPSKWGETSTLITKSDDPFDPSKMSGEELDRMIADLEAKDRIMKSADLFGRRTAA